MDWSRAKTILIIAFILLDLLLGFQLYTTMQKKSQYMTSSTTENTNLQSLLAKYQIRLEQPLPSSPKQIMAFKAKTTSINDWDKKGAEVYQKTFTPPLAFKDEKHRTKILQKEVPRFQDYVYSENDSTANKLVYLQMKGNQPIYNSHFMVHLEHNKLKSIELTHYQTTHSFPITLSDVNNTLAHLIQSGKLPKSGSPITIKEASLGYWAYPTADEQTILPVWRFYINDHFYLIPANDQQSKNVEIIKKL
jgi:regulatory protein YycI of two-component signal transduction system YycFG